MHKLKQWLAANPIASFFVLVLLVTYLLLFPILYLMETAENSLAQLLLLYAARLGVYVPVLIGIFITRHNHRTRSPASSITRRLSFVLVWLVALIIYALDLRRNISGTELSSLGLLIVCVPIALLPAYVVSRAFSPVVSLRAYLSTLVRPRGNLLWYLIALLTFPLLHLLGLVITQLLTGRPQLYIVRLRLTPEIVWATLLTFASVFFYSGGINEEGGWRGFAQRHLQGRYSPLATNLLLWAYLVVWHIPNDIIQYAHGGYLLVRFALYPFITILFGWVYNRTRGSILAPALFHASMNAMNTLVVALPMTPAANVMLVLFALFAILLDRMWQRLPTDHPATFPPVSPRCPSPGAARPSDGHGNRMERSPNHAAQT